MPCLARCGECNYRERDIFGTQLYALGESLECRACGYDIVYKQDMLATEPLGASAPESFTHILLSFKLGKLCLGNMEGDSLNSCLVNRNIRHGTNAPRNHRRLVVATMAQTASRQRHGNDDIHTAKELWRSCKEFLRKHSAHVDSQGLAASILYFLQ